MRKHQLSIKGLTSSGSLGNTLATVQMARPRTRKAVRESREKAEKAIEEAEKAEQEGTTTATEEKTTQPSAVLEDEQKSSGKRLRPKDISPEPARDEKRQRVSYC